MNNLKWKSTYKNEYPENGQECLIYFKFTGYSISIYEYDESDIYTKHIFYDKGGFLGDEYVLWIAGSDIKDCKLTIDEVKKQLEIPQDYLDLFKR